MIRHPRLRAVLLPAVLLAGLDASRAFAGVDPDHERPLPWRSDGSLLFVVDLATAPAEDLRPRVDLSLRIPADQLRYRVSGDSLYASVRLSVEIKTRFGKPEHADDRTLSLVASAHPPAGYNPGHLLLETYRIPPGPHQVRVRLEQLEDRRPHATYVGRPALEKGTAEGLTTIVGYPVDHLAVARPLFLWPAGGIDSSRAKGSAFERAPGGAPVVPNPDRTYGLFAPVARAYFEVRPALTAGAATAATGQDTVVARVLTPDGHLMAVLDSTVVDATGAWAGRLGFDASTLPAGSYDLEVLIRSAGQQARERNRFNVAWRRESWERDPREFLEEAHFLLDDPDLEQRYSEDTAGEQEAWLDAYWKEKDPTPLTAQNEERDRFRARVAYANDHYSIKGVVKGMLSDRGRIYVKYGEPDEILQEVIPTGDKSLEEIAVEVAATDDPSYIALRKPGGIGADERPWEVWIYNRLAESQEDRLRHGSQRSFQRKFVFVDERGFGDYALKYSTE